MTEILGEKALPLWKMRILHAQIKSMEEAEESFQAALRSHPLIARDIKPMWLEWLVLTKGNQINTDFFVLCVVITI